MVIIIGILSRQKPILLEKKQRDRYMTPSWSNLPHTTAAFVGCFLPLGGLLPLSGRQTCNNALCLKLRSKLNFSSISKINFRNKNFSPKTVCRIIWNNLFTWAGFRENISQFFMSIVSIFVNHFDIKMSCPLSMTYPCLNIIFLI